MYLFSTLLLQAAEAAKLGGTVAQNLAEQLKHESTLVQTWSTLAIILAIVTGVIGFALFKQMSGNQKQIDEACKQRLEGYEKASQIEKERYQQSIKDLVEKHALEIGVNEANHQSVVRGMQRTIDESTAERRELTQRINIMAEDVADVFEKFTAKMSVFADLQATQASKFETFRLELLLEIKSVFSKNHP